MKSYCDQRLKDQSEKIFLEVATQFQDFHTGESKSCEDFAEGAGTSVGLTAYYSIYWLDDLDNAKHFKRRNNEIRINKT